MLGFKKFCFYVFGIILVGLIAMGILGASQSTDNTDNTWILVWGCICLIPLIIMLLIRSSTKCPKCKEVWVAKKTGDEDMGVSSNAYTKKVGDEYRTYEKHNHLLSYRCTSCGHEWQKTVERERQL